MKRKEAILRLSPNEEARIIREEYERRRKLRIQQVVLGFIVPCFAGYQNEVNLGYITLCYSSKQFILYN